MTSDDEVMFAFVFSVKCRFFRLPGCVSSWLSVPSTCNRYIGKSSGPIVEKRPSQADAAQDQQLQRFSVSRKLRTLADVFS